MVYVYVLRSLSDGNFYSGYTSDLKRRMNEHHSGLSKSTKHRLPVELVYYEASQDIKDAMRRERYLKTTWGKRYIKNRIKKLIAVETIWKDLSKAQDSVPSPPWHADVLRARERRVQEGQSSFKEWSESKKNIRKAIE